jgi:hypothetical protein
MFLIDLMPSRNALAVVSTQAELEEKNEIYVSAGMPEQQMDGATANAIYEELQDEEMAGRIGLEGDQAVDELQKVRLITYNNF